MIIPFKYVEVLYYRVLRGAVWSQELNPMILVRPFQLGYSMIPWSGDKK